MSNYFTTVNDLRNWVWEHIGDNCGEAHVMAVVDAIRNMHDCPRWGSDWTDWLESLPQLVELIADELGELDEIDEIAKMLCGHGDRFGGKFALENAQDWIDHDFTAAEADPWCGIGVWDAGIAAQLRDAGLTPADAEAAAETLTDAEVDAWDAIDAAAAESDPDGWRPCDRDSVYIDDPIYSVCNGDTDVSVLIEAAQTNAPR